MDKNSFIYTIYRGYFPFMDSQESSPCNILPVDLSEIRKLNRCD